MDILDRWAKSRLENKGLIRAVYRPAPGAMTGVGGVTWPGDNEDFDPELYLQYSRRSNIVYACSALRANMLSGLPLRAYKLGADPKAGRVRTIREPHERLGFPRDMRVSDAQDVTELDGGKLVDLLRRVNRWWTPRRLVHMTELSLCLAGQAFWQLDRGEKATNTPSDIYYIKHTRMAPVKDRAEIIGGWTLDPNTRGKEDLQPDEVVWFRFPDPTDPDYGALPPLAAARLGADTYAAAMKSNYAIFANGLAPGGFVMPPEGQQWDEEQLEEAQESWRQKLEGVNKRHRWLFMPEPYTVKENTMTPRDAEFLGGMDFSVEDVARAYGLPIEMVGGARRTYQNLENAMRAVWMFTMEPEASFIAAELTEQLVPLFGADADFVAFDLSDVTALQEDEAMRWARAKEQLTGSVITINEWRTGEGMDPVPWGDVTWMPPGVQPVADDTVPQPQPLVLAATEPTIAETAATGGTDGAGRGSRLTVTTDVPATEYGSELHLREQAAEDAKIEPHEESLTKLMDDLFARQAASLADKMRSHKRMTLADLRAMFDMQRWVREFRSAIMPELRSITGAAGGDLFAELGGGSFDGDDPAVVRAMLSQGQKFATEVNSTTWDDIRSAFAKGTAEGESLPLLQKRLVGVLEGYTTTGSGDSTAEEIAAKISRAEMIARTETTRAWSNGAYTAAMQNPNVKNKRWSSGTDSRTRPSHQAAHGQEVPKADPFSVGGYDALYPGDPDLPAGESINCRCRVVYVTGTFVDKGTGKAAPLADFDDDGNLVTP